MGLLPGQNNQHTDEQSWWLWFIYENEKNIGKTTNLHELKRTPAARVRMEFVPVRC